MTRARRWNPLAIVLGAATAAVLALLGFIGFLGYYGGPLYRFDPPTAPTPVALRGTTVLFMSGDAGFNIGMGPIIIRDLAARGLPVLGFNTLTAFAHRRTPAQASALVAAAVRRALAVPGTRRVVLVGQSFGADMMQHGVADLPRDLRPRVRELLMVVPSGDLLFKTRPIGLFYGRSDAPALPSAQRIDWLPVVCIHGATEDGSLCPLWHRPNVRSVALPGDHFLEYNSDLLSNTLWRAIAAGH